MTIVKWLLALVVGGFLLAFGIMKFAGAAFIFPYIEYKAGAAGLPLAELAWPLGNYAVGAVEVLAGALVILPMTRRLGSLLAVAPLFGAVIVHLSPYLGTTTPLDFASPKPVEALAAGGGFVRDNFTAETGPMLFMMASVMLAIALANLFVQRRG
jgi:uncharacterized membrane protein YphA (DoxX/SURF4 family)